MHSSCSQREVGVALVVARARAARRASAARRGRARTTRATARQLGVRGRRGRQLGEHELDGRRGDPPRGRRRACRPPSRRGTASCRRRPDPAAPSTPTMQTRQAPNGSWRSSKQSVGTAPPTARTASSTVVPGATSVGRAVDLDLNDVMRVRAPPESVPTGCGSVPAFRRRGRTASRARASRAALRATRDRRGAPRDEHLVRAAQADPAGKALAAALGGAEVQQVRGERAHVGRLVEGDDPAVAEHAADRREVVEVKRRVEQRRGQDPAERAADLQRLDLMAVDAARPRRPRTARASSSRTRPRRRPAARSAR